MSTSTPIDTAALNAAFQALSPAEKRRAIARDVLERLAVGRLIPSPGSWVVFRSFGAETDLQAALHDPNEAPCYCCALGAAACGVAHFEDALKLSQHHPLVRELEVDAFRDRLIELFGLHQIGMIERVFEGSGAAFLNRLSIAVPLDEQMTHEEEKACYELRWALDGAHAYLKAIWADVAADPEGLFNPTRALATINAAVS